MADFIYGRWPVLETIRANRRHFEQVLIAEGIDEKGNITDIMQAAELHRVNVRRVPRRIVDDLARGANHQGVVLRCGEYHYADVDDMLALAQERGEKPFLLVLDLLKDPQNVGSLLRVGDSVGIHGVIMQERRGVSITPAVVSASSGASEHLLVAQVNNLVNTMKKLKEYDIWLVGLDVDPHVQRIDRVDLNMGLGIVLGSEGDGMRRLVRETCDILMTLPMRGAVESLNVSTVGSIALYIAWQARDWEGWQVLQEQPDQ